MLCVPLPLWRLWPQPLPGAALHNQGTRFRRSVSRRTLKTILQAPLRRIPYLCQSQTLDPKGGSSPKSCTRPWLPPGTVAARTMIPLSHEILRTPFTTKSSCPIWVRTSWSRRLTIASPRANFVTLCIGSGILLPAASSRLAGTSSICALWTKSLRKSLPGLWLSPSFLSSVNGCPLLAYCTVIPLTQARGVLAWWSCSWQWPWPWCMHLHVLASAAWSLPHACVAMWHCCPASACVLQPPGFIRALAVDMGREGRSRRNSSRPGRWARSLDVGEGTTADEETSSHEPHEPSASSRATTSYKALLLCLGRLIRLFDSCGGYPANMPGILVADDAAAIHPPLEPPGISMQSYSSDSRSVQEPLLDKDVAARLRTLARWVQRPPPLTLFGRLPQDQPKSVITVLPIEAMLVDADWSMG